MPRLDISGLPLFFANDFISTKLDDGSVMVVGGIRQGGEFTPLYATVSPTECAIAGGERYVEVARSGVSH